MTSERYRPFQPDLVNPLELPFLQATESLKRCQVTENWQESALMVLLVHQTFERGLHSTSILDTNPLPTYPRQPPGTSQRLPFVESRHPCAWYYRTSYAPVVRWTEPSLLCVGGLGLRQRYIVRSIRSAGTGVDMDRMQVRR